MNNLLLSCCIGGAIGAAIGLAIGYYNAKLCKRPILAIVLVKLRRNKYLKFLTWEIFSFDGLSDKPYLDKVEKELINRKAINEKSKIKKVLK